MKLRLDTAGLRALIADNPEFEIEIQQVVINNIKADQIENAVKARIEGYLQSLCHKSSGWNPTYTVKDPGLERAIKAAVELAVKEFASPIIKGAIEDAIIAERVRLRNDMANIAKEALLLAITPEMAKEIMLAKLL